jgi:dephospho-CoA kinase
MLQVQLIAGGEFALGTWPPAPRRRATGRKAAGHWPQGGVGHCGILAAMIVIGLTGNIGVGKSTVSSWLADRGAFVVDADKVAHSVMEPGGPAYAAVVEAFGPQILRDDGAIDRKALGAIVFADAERLAQLEAIVHPAVLARTQELLAGSDASVAVIEAIKLLEARNLLTLCDEVWVVTASRETILRRLMQSRGMDEAEALRRLAAQSSQEEKVRHATRVLSNDGSLAELDAQLQQMWYELTEKAAQAE